MQQPFTLQLMDGKKVANLVRLELKEKVERAIRSGARKPGLSVLLIGDDPASHIYVRNKVQACKSTGIDSRLHQFPATVSEDEVLRTLSELNQSNSVDGILVQLPLPGHLSTERILEAVSPTKDVDGLHPYNLGLLLCGKSGLRPCTPQGIMVLLDHYGIELSGKRAVVIGRSNLVGKPIALMLMERHATVTMCHSRSQNLPEISASADILIVASGKESMVRGQWIKPAAVVVDVGIHRRESAGGFEMTGDVDFQEASKVASYITPVPGGVGPMTVAMLLSNTLASYQIRTGLDLRTSTP